MGQAARKEARSAVLFASPWFIGFSVFLAYPLLASIYYSFCDYSVLRRPVWVGWLNYSNLVKDEVFWISLRNTAVYALMALPLGMLTAVALALLLNTKVRGMTVYRTIFFLPSLVPTIPLAVLWLWVFNGEHGILNYVLERLPAYSLMLLPSLALLIAAGILYGKGAAKAARWALVFALLSPVPTFFALSGGWGILERIHSVVRLPTPNWMSDTTWSKPALALMALWGAGNAMVIYLAGLQDVPTEMYEAAELDGAGWWARTRHVTLPMISPVILFNGIMGIIGTLQVFAEPYVMFPGGAPARSTYFYTMYLFDNAFIYHKMGYACAMGWILFLIILALTLVALRVSERHVHYQGG
jgi:multiple sugar transport system permease protein